MNIYLIGGSPCSGKSTVAHAISEKYGFDYFKVDDHLDRYMQKGAADGKASCRKIQSMTPEMIWMREPQEQCDEELRIYEEIFPYVLADLKDMDSRRGIITEGAAYLPALIKGFGIPSDRYISITPTEEFQISHYRQREWVPYVLEGCSDKAAAFDNWMCRDVLFAKAVRQQCDALNYASLITDGKKNTEEMLGMVCAHFGLE